MYEYKSEISGYYPGITPIVTVLVDSPNIVDNISRSYMKLQDLLAKIGGMINALFIVTKILSFHYLRFLYILKLISISKEEDNKHFNSNKAQESIEKIIYNTQTAKLNNYIPNIAKKKVEKQELKENKTKICIEERKNGSDFSFDDKLPRKQNIDINYSTYLWYIVSCKTNKFQIHDQILELESKIDVKTMIRISNSYYNNGSVS